MYVYVNIKYFTKKTFFLYDEGNNHNFYSNVVPSYLHGSKHRKIILFFHPVAENIFILISRLKRIMSFIKNT